MENASPKYSAENSLRDLHFSPPLDPQKKRGDAVSFTEIIVLADNLSTSRTQSSCQQKKQRALEELNIEKTHAANNNVFHEEGLQHMEWKKHHQKPPLESNVTFNNFRKILNSKCKTEKANMTISVKHKILNNSELDAPMYPQQPEEEKKLPVSAAIAHPGKKVQFIKGVLNNQSERGSLDSPCENKFTFAKNLASMIRDSIELTKVKNKELWGNNQVQLKGRWCDEEPMKENNSWNHTEDQRSHHNRALELSRPDPNLTPPATTGHHFAKQAWADVEGQVGLQKERTQKVSGSLISLSGASKTPGRKGTIYVHLPPATEVKQIAGSKGKNLISQPARGRMTSEEKGMDLECTPTDEQISQIWHSVRSAMTTQHGRVDFVECFLIFGLSFF